MLNCNKVQQLLAEYRTEILDERRCQEIEQHIKECSECAAELRVLDEMLSLVESNTPSYEPPAGLWNGVYNRISAPSVQPLRWDQAICRWIKRPVHAVGVGLTTLVLAATLITASPWHSNTAQIVTASNEYSQGHALYASQAPFANQANYISLVALSESKSNKD